MRCLPIGLLLVTAASAAAQPSPAPAPADDDAIVIAPVSVRAGRGRRGPAGGVGALDGPDSEAAGAERALDEPAFVTQVRVDDRAGETATVADVLARGVGVHVRSLGGLGAFASLSLRGAPSGQTAVLVDGVPLSRIASVAADLGRFELDSFAAVEVYRGGVPIALGGAAVGGAVNFVTAIERGPDEGPVALSAGLGSFGARHLRGRLRAAAAGGRLAYQLAAGYAGAAGDYSYFNDNGTPLNPDDDAVVDRTNNGFDQADVVARGRWQGGGGPLTFGLRALWKRQGVPGLASVQSRTAELETVTPLVDARYDRPAAFGVAELTLSGSAYVLLERQRFTDLDGEVGLAAQDRRATTLAGGAAGQAIWALGTAHLLAGGLEARLEDFDDDDLVTDPEDARGAHGRRIGAGVAAADEIALGGGDRIVLIPAVRVDALHTDPGDAWDPRVDQPDEVEPRSDLHASPRAGLRARLTDALALKANAGRYLRAPTLVELFGDRGYVVGNPTLDAETGLGGDLGAVLAPAGCRHGIDRLYLEGALFAARPRSTIALVPTAGRAAVAQNLGNAVLYGLETAGSLRLARHATVSGNYTLLDSRQDSPIPAWDGKRLPQRPRHQAYLRVDVAGRAAGDRLWVVWADALYTSGNYLDAANTSEVPARRLLGAGLKAAPVAGLLLGVEVKNLADERIEPIELDPPPRPDLTSTPRAVADFLGYPLPGRAFYVTAEWTP